MDMRINLFHRILAVLAILAGVAGTGVPLISSVSANESKLKVDLRTFYFNRDKQEMLPDSVALTQALMLYYESPYLNDRIGFDLSGFGNMKLSGEQGEGGTGLLRDFPDGTQHSYARLAEALVKLKLTAGSELRLGRDILRRPLLNDPDFRATPTSTQAGILEFRNQQTELYAMVSDKGAVYTDTDFSAYTDSNGDEYNIFTAGFNHRFGNSLYLDAAIGHADNIKNQIFLNIRYPWQIRDDMRLMIDAYQYSGRADGEGALPGLGEDYRSDLSNLALQLTTGNLALTASFQAINGDRYQLPWDGENHDDTSYVSWQSVQRMNFDRAGERSWQLRADYNFKQHVKGLGGMIRYISGDNIDREDGGTGSEWERDMDLFYRPPGTDNLTIRWRYAVVRSSETYDSDEHRFIINYSLNVL